MAQAEFTTPETPGDDDRVARELQLLRSAEELVATGRARRVTFVMPRAVDAILREAEALGRGEGVRVRVIPRGAGQGWDITVEPLP